MIEASLQKTDNRKVVAIMSGGPDSTGYAYIWKMRGYEIHPLIFNYGQKASKEVEIAAKLANKLGFSEPKVLDISFMKKLWPGTQLTDEIVRVEEEYTPSVVVPIRNAVFLVIATAYAYSIGAKYVIYGAHADDIKPRPDTGEPLYPDCSPEFLLALQTALNIGHFRKERGIELWSPARENMKKSQVLKKFYELVGDIVYETWSCYLSGEKHCGRCESCRNRRKAFIDAGIPDKTEYIVEPT